MNAFPWLLAVSAAFAGSPDYAAGRLHIDGFEVIHLRDHVHDVEVWVAPEAGNNAYRMRVKGTDVVWSPYASLGEWRAKPALFGNPFLAPWANRLEGDEYVIGGRRYVLDDRLGNFRRDPNGKAIHGLLTGASWEVVSLEAGATGAVLVSRLEFWRHPDWMAQFPFAHALEVTHRLMDGVLEVETVIENLSREAVPVTVGFHPYYQVTDAARDEWTVRLPARTRLELDAVRIPTGRTEPNPWPDPLPLSGVSLDDPFMDLLRDAEGWAAFQLQGRRQRVILEMGPEYAFAQVFAPEGKEFVCFEPMSAAANALVSGARGVFPPPTVPPGGRWRGVFRVRTEGFGAGGR